MPCFTVSLEEMSKRRMLDALKKLDRLLSEGAVGVVVGPTGAVAFKNWGAAEREGWTDVCAFRRLQSGNSAALRKALARAEAMAGRQIDQRAVASGLHSHDGGASWGTH